MPFHPLSTLPEMQSIYRLPRSPERFARYLALLQGGSGGDLLLPISGFNPMANDFAAGQLDALIALNAAGILTYELARLNALPAARDLPAIGVGLNLADDVGGAWTNRATTDYSSKFSLNGLVSRNFCAPYLWTSETVTPVLLATRIREYAFRTIHWYQHGQPLTLADHVKQEAYVRHHAAPAPPAGRPEVPDYLAAFYAEHQHTDNHHLIFAFFYGDAAAEPLGFRAYGVRQGFWGEIQDV